MKRTLIIILGLLLFAGFLYRIHQIDRELYGPERFPFVQNINH